MLLVPCAQKVQYASVNHKGVLMNPLISEVSTIIHLAVAPVFLLAGIAGFLNVMSTRLGRIIDRARVVERELGKIDPARHPLPAKKELRTLWRRVTITHWSIGLCTAAALLVCTLIAGLFIGGLWSLQLGGFVVGCFVLALALLIAALLLYLKEIQLATKTLREGSEFLEV